MDKNVQWHQDLKVSELLKSLEKNNMKGFYIKTKEELIEKIKELIPHSSLVGVGDSMTLFETGIINLLRNGDYVFLDKYEEGLSMEDKNKLYTQCFSADTFLCSVNAITEKGELYNVDGYGARVAPMIFGPKQVIIVAGKNKIVKDLKEAENRIKNIAAPIDAKRLNKDTPCVKLGYCVDCQSQDRICNTYVVIKRQFDFLKDRIKVIIIDENLGY
ncbi:MAG: lactate utilization protein [Clostridiaceae bacterium]